jgi:hypothetical protein
VNTDRLLKRVIRITVSYFLIIEMVFSRVELSTHTLRIYSGESCFEEVCWAFEEVKYTISVHRTVHKIRLVQVLMQY